MAMPGTVSFKAYLREKGGTSPKEVRRFAMEQSEVASFNRLKTKLKQVFPGLAEQTFSVCWRDIDGDDIIISSDDELLTALTENNDQVRRLYLDVSGNPSHGFPPFELIDAYVDVDIPMGDAEEALSGGEDEGGNQSGEQSPYLNMGPKEHYRVICDGCNNKITSHRYKCVECPDFDLCLTCESRGLHAHHIMTRIPLSNSLATRHPYFLKGLHSFNDAVRKIQHRRKKNERRWSRMCSNSQELNKMANNYFMDFEKCMRDSKCENKSEKKGKKSHCHVSFSTKEACGGASTSQAPTSEADSNAHQFPFGNQKPAGSCPITTGLISSVLNKENLNAIQRFLEHISPVPEQLLQEVAKSLAGTTLNDNPGPASQEATTASQQATTASQQATTASQQATTASQQATTASQQAATASNPAEFFSNPGPSNPGPSVSPVAVPVASASESLAFQHDSEMITPMALGSPSPPIGQSPRSGSAEPEAEGWMVIEPQDGQTETSAYPRLPSVEPTPPAVPPQPVSFAPLQPVIVRDRAVNICLERLNLMGYNVDDQFIVEMVEQNRGDLYKVLDLLG